MGHRRFAIDRPIILVGLPGAGKTTVGRRLAERLDLPFVDADEEIEREAGLMIREIFDRFGEAGFRERERAMVARLAAGPRRVIAAGGGAFDHPETRRMLVDCCRSVWIEADVNILIHRLENNNDRPLLLGKDLRDSLSRLASLRNPLFAAAPLRVSGAGRPEEVATAIAEALAEEAA